MGDCRSILIFELTGPPEGALRAPERIYGAAAAQQARNPDSRTDMTSPLAESLVQETGRRIEDARVILEFRPSVDMPT
jgi:hypothetical protein